MAMNWGILNSVLVTLLVIVVLFSAYAAITPDVQTSGDSLNASNRCESVGCVYNDTYTVECRNNISVESIGCQADAQSIPLSGFFGSNGIVFLIVMAMLIVLVVRSVWNNK